MARRQPDLLGLLPEDERPDSMTALDSWILNLPHRRLMEICAAWVLEAMRRLKETSPLTNVLLRGCLQFSGEFNMTDAAAVAIGEVPEPQNPRWAEIRTALGRAVRAGVLIHLRREERYCIPFPVRLSFEGVDFLDSLERESIRLRMIHHFAGVARELADSPELSTPKYWRFSNMLLAYEYAADLMEELLGLETSYWMDELEQVGGAPDTVAGPLVDFGRFLGRALVVRQSAAGGRLLAASVAAARHFPNTQQESDALNRYAQFYLRRKEFPRAIQAYGAAEGLNRRRGDVRGTVLSMSAMALAYREMGRFDEAINEFLRACLYARTHDLHEEELDTANCAAQLMIQTRQYQDAIYLVRQVVEALKRTERRFPAFAELLVRYGLALRYTGKMEESREWLLSALGISRSFLHRPAEARCFLELGRLAIEEGSIEEGAKWFRRARSAFAELSDYGGLSETYLDLFRAAAQRPESADYETLVVKALKAARKSGDRGLEAESWHERGLLALRHEDSLAAMNFFHRELEARRKTRSVEPMVRTHLIMAQLYLGQEAAFAAGTEILRAQALWRAYLEREECPPQLETLLHDVRRHLSKEQFEYLVEEVSEELETGALAGRKPERRF